MTVRPANRAQERYLDLGRIEAVLPPPEQIPLEGYRQASASRPTLSKSARELRNRRSWSPAPIPVLLKMLFEIEVPRSTRHRQIRRSRREAGTRSKIAVSFPTATSMRSALRGAQGLARPGIVDELRGEKIDMSRESQT